MQSSQIDFIPVLMHVAFCVVMIFTIIFVSNLLGPKVKRKGKSETFECGLPSLGNARTPFAIRYFLVAILFVLFDIEIIFMYPWAVNYSAIGLSGLLKMGGFILLLFIAYLYIVKRKALDWEK